MTVLVKKISIGLIASLIATGLLAGCSNTDNGFNNAEERPSKSDVGTTVIEIASSATAQPYIWKNDKGEIEGFDFDVANAIDEKVPEIELHWNSTDFQSLFLGLDASRYQVVASNIVKNPDREKKYDFSDHSYLNITYAIVYNADQIKGNVDSLSDLAGRTVGTFSDGSASQTLVETFNKEHPDKALNLTYTEGSVSNLLLPVENGQVDATVVDAASAADYTKEHGTNLKVVDLPKEEEANQGSKAYFLFGKDVKSEFAKHAFDKGLDEIIKDGTLSEISIKHFGKDYTKN